MTESNTGRVITSPKMVGLCSALWELPLNKNQKEQLEEQMESKSSVTDTVLLRSVTFQVVSVYQPCGSMEQQPRKRGRPRLLVTADVVERRKNSKRLQNAKRAYKRGEELSEGGCSAHSPNIAGSPTGGQSSSDACPALDDARPAGNTNVEETSLVATTAWREG
ncbi:hypothetical protein DCAR_0205981 [Daucus carota subsp. sativus]|uniref:Uncharacterized protein n=1 Tax=Daucus carota subsp. sativus TaxID=79200 RepID=A0A166CYB4_DAUCS|nr:hypothetical protein DCAR_0205981 [Daucus carota subsp. sativus]